MRVYEYPGFRCALGDETVVRLRERLPTPRLTCLAFPSCPPFTGPRTKQGQRAQDEPAAGRHVLPGGRRCTARKPSMPIRILYRTI